MISEASEENGEEGGDPASVRDLNRASKEEAIRPVNDERHQRKQDWRREKADLARMTDERRGKEMKLSNLSSVLGHDVGGSIPGDSRHLVMECCSCGEKGHVKRECPHKGKRRNED